MTQDPRWTCPACGGTFRQRPYDIGSGPEVACPHCEHCWGAEGQDLKALDVSEVNARLDELGLRPPGKVVGTLRLDYPEGGR